MSSPILFRYSKPSSCLVFLFLIFCSFNHFPCTLSQEFPGSCKTSFICGNITVGFPFWGELRPEICGHPSLGLRCDGRSNMTFLIISDLMYRVFEINTTFNNTTLRLARQDFLGKFCSASFSSATLTSELFEVSPDYRTLSVHYLCDPYLFYNATFVCPQSAIGFIDQNEENHKHCEASFNINVPLRYVPEEAALHLEHLESVLKQGFVVKLKIDVGPCHECQSNGGFCNYGDKITQACCKRNSTEEINCLPMFPPEPSGTLGKSGLSHEQKQKLNLGIGLASGLLGVILIAGSLYCFISRRRKKLAARYTSKDLPVTHYSSDITSYTQTSTTVSGSNHSLVPSISNLANGSVYFGVQVFSYEELEEATENFSKELGDGGFGTVYYGLLKDGREVAVKKLFERSLKRVEQFKNEIEILKSLKHPNLVILYGCTSRHSRELLLVYEYISNGTLAEHLHGNHVGARTLCWPTRLNIAIETASALSFLHASGIIHRDVKTTNILLDSNYQVKVADFGLSRLFPTDQTHISTAPQGTPGYVDPEYYQCYRLNEKSDVYSFGVVLSELISSKEAVDITRHRHDINLANMAVTKIQNNAVHELVDPKLGFARDPNVKRMMMSVAELAFRCLQQEREVRPSMDEVLDVLQSIKDSPEEVVDIDGSGGDRIGLLKDDAPPPLSPETDKWMSSSSTTGSSL